MSVGHLFPEDGAIAVSTCEFATLDHGKLAALIQADDSSHGPLVFFPGATRSLIRYRFSILHRSACLANEWPLPNSAGFYLDGNLQATVDTYLTPSKANSAIYSLSGLTAGVHTLGITGDGNTQRGFRRRRFPGSRCASSRSGSQHHANGVVNAASFAPAPNNQVARGQIISIFGQNLIPGGSAGANTTPLPTQLGPQNTSITACGQAIPLYTVSHAGQRATAAGVPGERFGYGGYHRQRPEGHADVFGCPELLRECSRLIPAAQELLLSFTAKIRW